MLDIYLIGGYNKTRTLAKSLLKKGHKVTAINSNEEYCRELAETDSRLCVYKGDGSKPFILEESSIYNADIAVALTDKDADNLVICELCKKKFKVKKTVSLVSDPRKIEFFYRMGIDSVVCAVTSVSGIIEQLLLVNEMSTFLPVGEGRVEITQVAIPSNSKVVGKTLMEIKLPKEVVVGCIMRGDKIVIPRGDTHILTADVLLLISAVSHHAKATKILTDV
ncbi:MAG: NAD-binding protein [Oscillospiraceae bacterium]|jgi:trk system potassium uptake protein TrkA|nr:NAD-binding protein [Oscillospiraceae bacterium]